MAPQEIEGNGTDVSCVLHATSSNSNRFYPQFGLSGPRHAFSWAMPSLDTMQVDRSANPPLCGASEVNQASEFVHDAKDILQLPAFLQGSITSDSDFLPTAPGVTAAAIGDLFTSTSTLCSSSPEVQFGGFVNKELIPGLDMVRRADGLNLFHHQDSINFVADAFMAKKDAAIRWSHALGHQVANFAMDCACSDENCSSMSVSQSDLVDDGKVCNSHKHNVSIPLASSSFVPAQTATPAAASVMFPYSDAVFGRASGTLASVESVAASESAPTTQLTQLDMPMVAKFSQLRGHQDENCSASQPTKKMASTEADLGIRVPAAEIGHGGASNATNSRYNLDAPGGDGSEARTTAECGEVEGVPIFCDPAGMFSVTSPALLAPIMAGFPHAPAYPPPPLDRASMKEMSYRAAAFRPTTNISIDAISRPKRKNMKISKDPQSVAARHRRERISDRIRILQRLVPGGTKMDTASMLDEAIQYVKFLKMQVQAMERLEGNGLGQSWSSIGAALPSSALHSCYPCNHVFTPRSIAPGGEKGSCSTSFPCLGQPIPDQFQLQQSCH